MTNVIQFNPPTATDQHICKWVESSKATWRTSCGETVEEMELSPKEGGLHFCAYCGKELVQEAYPERKI